MNQPLVTVFMAAYNGERYIRRALDSALAQTYPRLEVVVVDDGSTDSTPRILAEYDNRIRWFTQPNAGQAVARNLAVLHARGEWVAMLDQDDLWDPSKIEHQVAAISAEVAVVHCSARQIDTSGQTVRPAMGPPDMQARATLLDFIVCNRVTAPTVLIRKDAYNSVGGFDPANRFGTEDYQLWLRLAARGYRFRFLNQVLASYRWHGDNMSSNRARTAEGVIYALTKTMQEYPNAFGSVERRACRRVPSQLEHDRAWHLYNRGEYGEASLCFWRSVRLWPFSAKSWLYAIATSLPLRRILLPKIRGLLKAVMHAHN